MKSKPNPRRISVTMADVERAKKAAQAEAVTYAQVIFLTVLLDKEEADKNIIQRIWNEVNDLSDSIAQGYVNIADLRYTLNKEYDIKI